jgi:hypothetical protein
MFAVWATVVPFATPHGLSTVIVAEPLFVGSAVLAAETTYEPGVVDTNVAVKPLLASDAPMAGVTAHVTLPVQLPLDVTDAVRFQGAVLDDADVGVALTATLLTVQVGGVVPVPPAEVSEPQAD